MYLRKNRKPEFERKKKFKIFVRTLFFLGENINYLWKLNFNLQDLAQLFKDNNHVSAFDRPHLRSIRFQRLNCLQTRILFRAIFVSACLTSLAVSVISFSINELVIKGQI